MLKSIRPQQLSWLSALLFCIGLSGSKAMLSISAGAMGVAALWQMWEERSLAKLRGNAFTRTLALLWLLSILCVLITDDPARWIRDVKSKLLFLTLPLSLNIVPAFSAKQIRILFWAFLAGIF
ncbi:MAG: hypothetical protein AAF206_05200, partial [Bacteroidota bacterium]